MWFSVEKLVAIKRHLQQAEAKGISRILIGRPELNPLTFPSPKSQAQKGRITSAQFQHLVQTTLKYRACLINHFFDKLLIPTFFRPSSSRIQPSHIRHLPSITTNHTTSSLLLQASPKSLAMARTKQTARKSPHHRLLAVIHLTVFAPRSLSL